MNDQASGFAEFTPPKATPAPKALRIFVIVAGIAVGLGGGLLAGSFSSSMIVGGIAGAAGGYLAGLFWVTMMKHLLSLSWRILGGIVWGMVAGVIATQILWCAIAIWKGEPHAFLMGLLATLFFGIPAGAITGLLCGCLWLRVVPASITPREEESDDA